MPKIKINEVNATTQTPLNVTSGLPIAILGISTKGERLTPTLLRSVTELETIFGPAEPASLPYGYAAAKECLQLGNPVLFTRLAQSSYAKASYTIEGSGSVNILTAEVISPGSDGNNYSLIITLDGSTYTAKVYYKGVLKATGTFVKGEDTDIELLTVGGVKIYKIAVDGDVNWTSGVTYTGTGATAVPLTGGTDGDLNYTTTSIDSLMTDIAATLVKLQDTTIFDYTAIAIPGLTYLKSGTKYVWHYLADLVCGTDYTNSSFIVAEDKVAIIDASQTTTIANILTDLGLDGTEVLENLSIFYPWYTGTTITNSTARLLPPSIQYFKAFSKLQSDGVPCRPVAGPINGLITRISDMSPKIGVLISEQLKDLCINPLCYHRNFGYFIDGNAVYNPTATSKTYKQLSIRQTINYVKKELDNLCYRLSYSVHPGITRTQFQGAATRLLDFLKKEGFIFTYNITISDSTADIANGVLNVTVSIFPTPALEEFVINLRIVNVESNL